MKAFLYGFSIGLSLIFAIGSQNAFVLKQGLRGQFIFWVCLTCASADALLIGVGVSGFHVMLSQFPWIDTASRYGGAAFLAVYGLRSFLAVFKAPEALLPSEQAPVSLAKTLAICLAFTFLNPHVYLDTVVLMGTVSTKFPGEPLWFWLGATSASFAFFFSLGYGAILLRPVFENPKAWKVLDGVIGVVMWGIAWRLVAG